MSTLAYLDESGRVSYGFVGWKILNKWLSSLNGNPHIKEKMPVGVNRGKIIEELEDRRTKSKSDVLHRGLDKLRDAFSDYGQGKDWRDYENDEGYSHLEELLIYQPSDWRLQAREYLYKFRFNLERNSHNMSRKMVWTTQIEKTIHEIPIYMNSPIFVVLFHPDMKRSARYEPINFLLAYAYTSHDPLLQLYKYIRFVSEKNREVPRSSDSLFSFNDLMEIYNLPMDSKPDQISQDVMKKMKLELSPLDYFFHFQRVVQSYSITRLDEVGKNVSLPRLWLIKELDFSLIVGQRIAKHLIRQEVFTHFWHRSNTKDDICSNYSQPVSMIFAGPSGNGKTELAVWLSKLLNKPGEDAFLKIDCGKITDGRELFGMSGAFWGSKEGSVLNNFISRMALEPGSIGVVLLDEIEKSDQSVIHGLYQVLDKGEWTNKRLEEGRAQTEVISCRNIVFIMTTNAADKIITQYTCKHPCLYTGDMDDDDLEETVDELSYQVQKKLQSSWPFTEAFIGRIGKFVPFLPMGKRDTATTKDPLLAEMETVAKLLIEREVETIEGGKKDMELHVNLSPEEKERMAGIIVERSPSESGVRGIQKAVRDKVSKKLMHKCALETRKGGIGNGSEITFSTDDVQKHIRFRENRNADGNFAMEDSMRNLSLGSRQTE